MRGGKGRDGGGSGSRMWRGCREREVRGEMERNTLRDYDVRQISVCGWRGIGESNRRKAAFDSHWFIKYRFEELCDIVGESRR